MIDYPKKSIAIFENKYYYEILICSDRPDGIHQSKELFRDIYKNERFKSIFFLIIEICSI
jgi:hypothetical protein